MALRTDTIAKIRALAADGRSDSETAELLGLTLDQVRGTRRRLDIARGAKPGGQANGWQLVLRAEHAWGRLTTEIAARLGWGTRTVQTRLSKLGLRAHRPTRAHLHTWDTYHGVEDDYAGDDEPTAELTEGRNGQ